MGRAINWTFTVSLKQSDGCVKAFCAPAGFLMVSRCASRFTRNYPGLCYGDPIAPHIDLFNHGAHEGVWYGVRITTHSAATGPPSAASCGWCRT